MAYLRNEPVATDDLDVSQPKLRNNTNTADTSFGVNHYAFSDLTANNGKHNFIQLPNRTVIPPGLVNGDETVYSKAIAGNGELFFTRGSTGTEIQLTGPGVPSAVTNGFSWLPGGILIQWGLKQPLSAPGTYDVNFPITFPNACFSVTATPVKTTPNLNGSMTINGVSSVLTNKFQIRIEGTAPCDAIYFIAIGN